MCHSSKYMSIGQRKRIFTIINRKLIMSVLNLVKVPVFSLIIYISVTLLVAHSYGGSNTEHPEIL
jgi:hypothetical protein